MNSGNRLIEFQLGSELKISNCVSRKRFSTQRASPWRRLGVIPAASRRRIVPSSVPVEHHTECQTRGIYCRSSQEEARRRKASRDEIAVHSAAGAAHTRAAMCTRVQRCALVATCVGARFRWKFRLVLLDELRKSPTEKAVICATGAWRPPTCSESVVHCSSTLQTPRAPIVTHTSDDVVSVRFPERVTGAGV